MPNNLRHINKKRNSCRNGGKSLSLGLGLEAQHNRADVHLDLLEPLRKAPAAVEDE